MKLLPEKWRTVTGSMGLILGGVALFCKMLASEDGFDFEIALEAWAMIALGLGVFGVGKKIERGRIAERPWTAADYRKGSGLEEHEN